MSDLVKHFWDLCGGNIQTQEFNELATGAVADFTEDDWEDVITPTAGNRLVIFGIRIQAKGEGKAETATAFKVGDYYIGDFWLSDGAIQLLTPFNMELPVPAVGAVDASFSVFTEADTTTIQPSVIVTYGEFTP